MTRLSRLYHETRQRRTGKEVGKLIAIFNILTILATQIMNIEVPVLFYISMLLIFAGILFLEVRPRI